MISSALSMLETEEQRDILSEFYEENKNRFYGMAYSKLQNRVLAEDAVQEAFVRIMQYPNKFFEIEAHKKLPYVIIIIRNVVYQMLKKESEHDYDELTEDVPDNGVSIEDDVIGRISSKELMDFIKTLSEAKKQAVILKGVYGLNPHEIAAVLGITESAVRRRISDAYGRIIYYVRKGER